MKKILGIAILCLLCFSVVSAEDKTLLKLDDGKIKLSGDKTGGIIVVLGPAGLKYNAYDEWAKRLRLIVSGKPQKEFCKKFGLDAKPYQKGNYKEVTSRIYNTDRKYIGEVYNNLIKKHLPAYTTDKYSYEVILFSTDKFKCKNANSKKLDTNNDLVTEIEKLKALYEEGTLTKEQFEKAKDKLLN